MQVVAKRLGYYGIQRRREGDTFTLEDPKHFSPKWMEKISGQEEEEAEEKEPEAQQAKPRGRPRKDTPPATKSSERSVI
jgi:hypothetical protein